MPHKKEITWACLSVELFTIEILKFKSNICQNEPLTHHT